MDEKFIFQIAKHNLENANSKISVLIENYNAIVNDMLKDENQSMDVYRTLLIYSMKKAYTLEKMQPKSDNIGWSRERNSKAFEIRKRTLKNYEKILKTSFDINESSYDEVKKITDQIYQQEKAIWEKGEMHKLVERFKADITEKYCEDNQYVYTVLQNEPESKVLKKTQNRENQYLNEIVDAHFAIADYEGMIGYICRAVNGNGFHGSIRDGKKCCEYPENPFADSDKQDDANAIKLKKGVSVLLTDASVYEPVFDFAIDRSGKIGFRYDGEMIARSLDKLNYEKYIDYEDFKSKNPGKYYFFTRYGKKNHTEFDFSNTLDNIYLIFGKESTGIPKEILKPHINNCMRMPMTANVRSLNLSNTVAIMLYEALRQRNYTGLLFDEPHKSKTEIEDYQN